MVKLATACYAMLDVVVLLIDIDVLLFDIAATFNYYSNFLLWKVSWWRAIPDARYQCLHLL
jgi:hypothetical protein